MDKISSNASLTEQGIMLFQLGKFNHAEKKFAEAWVKNPKDSTALWGFGRCLVDQGKIREGKKELERGYALFPNIELFIDELTYIALTYDKDYKQAYHLIQQWLQRHPLSAKAHAIMGKIFLNEKFLDKKKAFHYFREALKINPFSTDAIDGLAYAYWDFDKNKEAAIQEYRKAIKHYPNNAVIHNNFGVILLRTGESKQAVEEFRQALRLNPNFISAENNLFQAAAYSHPLLSWAYKFNVFLYAKTWRRIIIMLLLYLFAKGLLLLYVLYLFIGYRLIISYLKKNG